MSLESRHDSPSTALDRINRELEESIAAGVCVCAYMGVGGWVGGWAGVGVCGGVCDGLESYPTLDRAPLPMYCLNCPPGDNARIARICYEMIPA